MPRSPRACASALAIAAACCALASPAAAQVPPPVPVQTDAAQLEQAKQHMVAGAAFYNDPSGHKCEEALREFRKAYVLSGSLNALRGMGICALELERDGEAISLLERYLVAKGTAIDPADEKQVKADLAALKAAVARVTFEVDRPDVRITTVRTPARGYPVTNRYELAEGATELGLHPGNYAITAATEGAAEMTWNVELANGTTTTHTFSWGRAEAAPAAPPAAPAPAEPTAADEASPEGDRPVPATVWIFGGLTVALAVPTGIFMASASGAKSDFDAANGRAPAAELEDMRSDVTTMNLLSDVFLGATVASAAATTIFYLTRPEEPATATRVVPVATTEGGGAFVTGTF
jgi:hypothetical protein